MEHAKEINKIIEFSSSQNGSSAIGFRAFEKEDRQQLSLELKNNNLFFSSSVLGMEAISHVIEDQAINLGGKYTFYTDFQKFSRLRPQKDRYEKLCLSGNPINLFGVGDQKLPFTKVYPNLKVVSLDEPASLNTPSLSHNWIVVLNNPQFVSIALVANELPAAKFQHSTRNENKLLFRNFEGFWTYDQTIINKVVSILEDSIETQSLSLTNQAPVRIQV